MMKKPLVIVFGLVGVAFAALAVYYWMTPAGSLPHSFPGYEQGSSHVHFKHGLAALILAFGSWVLAWFSMGKKPGATSA